MDVQGRAEHYCPTAEAQRKQRVLHEPVILCSHTLYTLAGLSVGCT